MVNYAGCQKNASNRAWFGTAENMTLDVFEDMLYFVH